MAMFRAAGLFTLIALVSAQKGQGGDDKESEKAMGEMHQWYCKGDGVSHWKSAKHEKEDKDMCDKWFHHQNIREMRKNMPTGRPSRMGVKRIHHAWCVKHSAAKAHTDTPPCHHYKRANMANWKEGEEDPMEGKGMGGPPGGDGRGPPPDDRRGPPPDDRRGGPPDDRRGPPPGEDGRGPPRRGRWGR